LTPCFREDIVNITENRPVLHVALRAPNGTSIVVNGENVVTQAHTVLDRMAEFSNAIRLDRAWAIPANAFETSSILVSAAPISSGDGLRGVDVLHDRALNLRFVFLPVVVKVLQTMRRVSMIENRTTSIKRFRQR